MQGYVQKISQKSGHGAKGPYTLFSMNVDGEWYGTGFNAPACKEGDYVSFDVVQKGKFKNAENVSVASQQSAVGSAPSGNIPVNKKDVSIHYQSCRKDAIQTLGVLLQHEAVKLPAKQADKYDAALAILDELTNQYYLKLEDVINAGGVTLEDTIPAPGDA